MIDRSDLTLPDCTRQALLALASVHMQEHVFWLNSWAPLHTRGSQPQVHLKLLVLRTFYARPDFTYGRVRSERLKNCIAWLKKKSL